MNNNSADPATVPQSTSSVALYRNSILNLTFANYFKAVEALYRKLNENKHLSYHQVYESNSNEDLLKCLMALTNLSKYYLCELIGFIVCWHDNTIDELNNNKMDNKDNQKLKLDSVRIHFLLVINAIFSNQESCFNHDEYYEMYLDLIGRIFGICREYTCAISSNGTSDNNVFINRLCGSILDGINYHEQICLIHKLYLEEIKENIPLADHISIISAFRSINVKLYPVEYVEEMFQFLMDCLKNFIELKEKDLKIAYAYFFMEILFPLSAVANAELNIPAIKLFIEKLYTYSFNELNKKAKYQEVAMPLVAASLCCSKKMFFLQYWTSLLNIFLTSLKSKDNEILKVSIECVYRLVWVYCVRFKGDSNSVTSKALSMITEHCFKNSKTSLFALFGNILVKIIHIMSQLKLVYVMNEVIPELIKVNSSKQIIPEKANVGIRAFIIIMDALQKKTTTLPLDEGISSALMKPKMSIECRSVANRGSATANAKMPKSLRKNKTLNYKTMKLSKESAGKYGLNTHFEQIKKIIESLLKILDPQINRATQSTPSNQPDTANHDRKMKLELFTTCISSITKFDLNVSEDYGLIELLGRAVVNSHRDLKQRAHIVIKSLLYDFPHIAGEIFYYYSLYIVKEVADNATSILDEVVEGYCRQVQFYKSRILAIDSNDDLMNNKTCESALSACHIIEGFSLHLLSNNSILLRKMAFQNFRDCDHICSHLQLSFVSKEVSVWKKLDWFLKQGTNMPSIFQNQHSTSVSKNLNMIERLLFSSENGNKNWFYILGKWLNVSRISECSPSASLIFQWINITRFTQTYSSLDVVMHETGMDTLNKSSLQKSQSKRSVSVTENSSWKMYALALCANGATKISSIEETSLKYLKIDTTKLLDYVSNDVYCKEVLLKLASNIKNPILFDKRYPIHHILGHMERGSHKYFLEIIVSICKEINEKKSDTNRKKRRKDVPKINLLKVFSCLADNDNLNNSMNTDTIAYYVEFLQFLDLVVAQVANNPPVTNDYEEHLSYTMKMSLLKTAEGIANAVYKSKYPTLLGDSSRMAFFNLIHGWLNTPSSTETLRVSCCATLAALFQSKSFLSATSSLSNSNLGAAKDSVCDTDIISLLEVFMSNSKTIDIAYQFLLILFENKSDVSKIVHWVIEKCLTKDKSIYEILVVILGEYCVKLNLTSMKSLIVPFFLVFSESDDENVLYAVRNVICFTLQQSDQPPLPSTLDFIHAIGIDHFRSSFNRTISKLLPSQSYSVINCFHRFYMMADVRLRHTIIHMQCCWLENIDFETLTPVYSGSLCNNALNVAHGAATFGDGDGDDEDEEELAKTKSRSSSHSLLAASPNNNNKYKCSSKESVVLLSNLFYLTHKHYIEYPEVLEMMWSAVVADRPLNLRYCLEILLALIQTYSFYVLDSVRVILSVLSKRFTDNVIRFLLLNLSIESAIIFSSFTAKFTTASTPHLIFKFGRSSNCKDLPDSLDQQLQQSSTNQHVQPQLDNLNISNHGSSANSVSVAPTSQQSNCSVVSVADDFCLPVYQLLACATEEVDMLKHAFQLNFIPRPIAAIAMLSDLLLSQNAFAVLGEDLISVVHFSIVGLTHDTCAFILNQCRRALVFVLISCYHSISELFNQSVSSSTASLLSTVDSMIHNVLISLSSHYVLSNILVKKYTCDNNESASCGNRSGSLSNVASVASNIDSNVGLEYLDQLVAESNAKLTIDRNNDCAEKDLTRLSGLASDMETILLTLFEMGNQFDSLPPAFSRAGGVPSDSYFTIISNKSTTNKSFPTPFAVSHNKNSFSAIKQLDLGIVCRKISSILSATHIGSTFDKNWAMICMNWALNPSSKFISQTSFQIYQLLEISMTLEDMYCLSERLVECVNELIETQQRNKNLGSSVKSSYFNHCSIAAAGQSPVEFDLMKIFELQFQLLLTRLVEPNSTYHHLDSNENLACSTVTNEQQYDREMMIYFIQLAIMWLCSNRPSIFLVGLRLVRLFLDSCVNQNNSQYHPTTTTATTTTKIVLKPTPSVLCSLLEMEPHRWLEVCPNFPGLLILVGRGILLQNDAPTCDSVIHALCEMLPYLNKPLICAMDNDVALSIHTLVLLSYLVEAYETPTHFQFTTTTLYSKIATNLINDDDEDADDNEDGCDNGGGYVLSGAIAKINRAFSVYSSKNHINQLEAWLELVLLCAFGDNPLPHVVDVSIVFLLQLAKNENIVHIFSIMHIVNALIKIALPCDLDVRTQLTDSISLISNKYLDDNNICKLSMDILQILSGAGSSKSAANSQINSSNFFVEVQCDGRQSAEQNSNIVDESTHFKQRIARHREQLSYMDWQHDHAIGNSTCYQQQLSTLVENLKVFIIENKLCDRSYQNRLQNMFEEFIDSKITRSMFRDVFSREKNIFFMNDPNEEHGDESNADFENYPRQLSTTRVDRTSFATSETITIGSADLKRSSSMADSPVAAGRTAAGPTNVNSPPLVVVNVAETFNQPQTLPPRVRLLSEFVISDIGGDQLKVPTSNSTTTPVLVKPASHHHLRTNSTHSRASLELFNEELSSPHLSESGDVKSNSRGEFDIVREMEDVFNNFKFLDEEFYDGTNKNAMTWNDPIGESSEVYERKTDTTLEIQESLDGTCLHSSLNDDSTTSVNLDYSENDYRFSSTAKISYEDIKVALRKYSSFSHKPDNYNLVAKLNESSNSNAIEENSQLLYHSNPEGVPTEQVNLHQQSLNYQTIKIFLQIDPFAIGGNGGGSGWDELFNQLTNSNPNLTASLARICLIASDIFNCVLCELEIFIKTVVSTTSDMAKFKKIHSLLDTVSVFIEKSFTHIPQLVIIPCGQTLNLADDIKDHCTVIVNQVTLMLQQVYRLKTVFEHLVKRGIFSGCVSRSAAGVCSFSCDYYVGQGFADFHRDYYSHYSDSCLQFVDSCLSSSGSALLWIIGEIVSAINSYNASAELVSCNYKMLHDILVNRHQQLYTDFSQHPTSSKTLYADVVQKADIVLQSSSHHQSKSGNKADVFQRFRMLMASLKYGDRALHHLSTHTSDSYSLGSIASISCENYLLEAKDEFKPPDGATVSTPKVKVEYSRSFTHAPTKGNSRALSSRSSNVSNSDELSKEVFLQIQLNVISRFYRPILEAILAMENLSRSTKLNYILHPTDRATNKHTVMLSKVMFSLKSLL